MYRNKQLLQSSGKWKLIWARVNSYLNVFLVHCGNPWVYKIGESRIGSQCLDSLRLESSCSCGRVAVPAEHERARRLILTEQFSQPYCVVLILHTESSVLYIYHWTTECQYRNWSMRLVLLLISLYILFLLKTTTTKIVMLVW